MVSPIVVNEVGAQRFNAYKLAFERIQAALESNFPLEAIAIEESILTDGVRGFLESNDALNEKWKSPDVFTSFGSYIQAARNLLNQQENAAHSKKREFLDAVDAWRRQRNMFLHGLVRVNASGMPPNINVDTFVADAVKIAKMGLKLARCIANRRMELPEELRNFASDLDTVGRRND